MLDACHSTASPYGIPLWLAGEDRMAIAMSRRKARTTKLTVIGLGLLFFGIWTLTPLYWIVVTSIKPNLLIYREPALFPSEVTFHHYAFVLGKTPFLPY